MADYTKTEHLGLDLYGDSDPADLRDGHNNNMRVLDDKVSQNIDDITATRGTVTELGQRVTTLDTQKASHDDVAAAVATKADTNAVYTKDEVDTTVATKADTNAVYTKDEVDTKVATKADTNAVYTKAQADAVHDLKADTADVYTKTQADGRFVAKDTTQPILIAIGDSYGSDASVKSWAYNLSQLMGCGLKNYCIGGSGYMSASDNFSVQADRAINDTELNKNLVQWIIVAGSRNDITDESSHVNAASSVGTKLRTAFPRARVIFIPLLWDYRPVSGYWRWNASAVMKGARQAGCETVPWAWTWLSGEDQYFTGEDIHPNAQGSMIVATYMHDYLRGAYTGRVAAKVIKSPNNTGLWTLEISGSAGSIQYSFYCKSGITPTDLVSQPGIPKWAIPSTDLTNSGRAWVQASTNSANETTLFKINGDGTWGWQGYTSVTKGTPNGEAGVSFSRPW